MGGGFPPLIIIVEHLALGLLFRASYHSFNGTNWLARSIDSIADFAAADATVAPAGASPVGA